MASEPVHTPINGHYEASQSYNSIESLNAAHTQGQAINGATSGQPNTAASNSDTSGVAETNGNPSKDEVGWYFVEQYYTTLSKSPDKLHLFYNKRSQFVSGVEAERVSVSVGQRAINERIKELDIQDCKVRVSNVDSQESFKNIVVQVIGEMSNKAAPHRKFVQTFVLAEQPNGYFVLNDIFRYINEEEEEEVEEQPTSKTEIVNETTPEELPKTLTSSDDLAAQEHDAELVDKKLEETIPEDDKDELLRPETTSNGKSSSEVEEAEEEEEEPPTDNGTSAAPITDEDKEAAEAPVEVEVEDIPAEKPGEPESTPVVSPPRTDAVASPSNNTTVPTPAPKPAAPKTWANLVAARAPQAAIPAALSATFTASVPPQAKATQAPGNPSISVHISNQPTTSDDASSPAQQSPGAGWQTAGQDSGKRQARQQSNSVTGTTREQTNILGYVKNVTEKVDAAELKATLNKYGKLEYFDVSRQKNCAFVEFADIAGYNAAVAANPHLIGGEQIYVEERRPRPTAYGGNFNNRGNLRGGRGGPEGRTPSQGRGSFQKDGSRGGFVPRGRGGNVTPRGRGMPQPA